MKIEKFEDLEVWQISLSLTREIYNLTSKKDFSKDFCLRDQIRRSVISISSNIVEGFEKNNNNEFIRYLKIAKGSVGEVRNQLYIALSIDYVTKTEFDKINNELKSLASKTGRFISYLESKRKNKEFIRTR